ncbi:hypothetical protein BJX99DRAFT_224468 [Aspergillus californicus]
MTLHESSQEELVPRETWPSPPGRSLPLVTGPTFPTLGRRFYKHSPSTFFKYGISDGEEVMTMLARSILGPCVPRVVTHVTISKENFPVDHPVEQGIVLAILPGKPLVEIWPSLTPSQRQTIKAGLCRLVVSMRKHKFSYYGRPAQQPYVIYTDISVETYDYCTSRSEWDDSRVRALHAPPYDNTPDADLVVALERVQRGTTGPSGWDRPVLTHVDLSDRNILVDPVTLAITGFLDWEMANIMPAYSEYVAARLTGGFLPEWRKEILDVLRSVLRCECDEDDDGGEERYQKTLAAWDAVVDVERIAQGGSEKSYWTFLPDASPKDGSAL